MVTPYRLYLAGPLFTSAERIFNRSLARTLETFGYAVWLPQEHEPREKTAKAIVEADIQGIEWADAVVACMDGPDPDSGTAWECGYAYAKGKPTFQYRTDFRAADDVSHSLGAGSEWNLMLAVTAAGKIMINSIADQTVYEIGSRIHEMVTARRVGARN